LNAGPAYARNAQTLRDVQPEDVLPGDIDANLGAPWIPESDIQAFAVDLFHVEAAAIQVGHLQKDAVWSIEADYAAERSVAATSEYGTSRAGGPSLLELADGPRVLPSADRKLSLALVPLCRLPCPLRVPDSRAG